jgi:SOS-response transcriptional repressor LexA
MENGDMSKSTVHKPEAALAKRLTALLARHGIERRGAGSLLAKKYGVATVTANAWLNGDHKMSADIARQIAKDYGAVFEEFYFGTRQPLKSEMLIESMPVTFYSVPLISFTTAGNWGEVCDSYQPGDGERPVVTTRKVSQRAFALRIRGDSMEPLIPNGSVVIVDPDVEALPGKVVVVRQNNDSEATIKTLIRDGSSFLLKPENPRYPILPMLEDAVICGVAIQFTKDIE